MLTTLVSRKNVKNCLIRQFVKKTGEMSSEPRHVGTHSKQLKNFLLNMWCLIFDTMLRKWT